MSSDVLGIDEAALSTWIELNVAAADPPFSFSRLAGGRSNLTFLVSCGDGRRVVLRRPPLGPHPPSAHDVLREARIVKGLSRTEVPVPEVLAECVDDAVTGAPFVITSFVEGIVCQGAADAEQLSPQFRQAAGLELVGTLARLHRVDPQLAGFSAGRRESYLVRQLDRWNEQWLRTRVRPLEPIERTYRLLSEHLPPQQPDAIVHGDYRFDNCILNADGSVAAVLDWEICAAGDPLADLALLLAYWAQPDDPIAVLEDPPTRVPGFPDRSALAASYLELSGRPPDQPLDFYHAFAWWKVACIVEGVYSRMLSGALGGSDRTPDSFADQARRLAGHAEQLARAIG